jgi:uncharacterized protein
MHVALVIRCRTSYPVLLANEENDMGIKLTNSFRLDLSATRAWALLCDIERVALCVPGAQLLEVRDNEYRGCVKVKLGPIAAEYAGTATIKEADAMTRTMIVEGKGRDVRGQGMASATMIAKILEDGDGARIDIATDLQVAGKVAQLGRGLMQDVAARLLDQFVENMKSNLPVEEAPGRTTEAAVARPISLLGLAGAAIGKRITLLLAVGILLAILAFVFVRTL